MKINNVLVLLTLVFLSNSSIAEIANPSDGLSCPANTTPRGPEFSWCDRKALDSKDHNVKWGSCIDNKLHCYVDFTCIYGPGRGTPLQNCPLTVFKDCDSNNLEHPRYQAGIDTDLPCSGIETEEALKNICSNIVNKRNLKDYCDDFHTTSEVWCCEQGTATPNPRVR